MLISLLLNSELFSSYKNHTTVKGLVGIAPSREITFLSKLCSGSISDREIVESFGVLDLTFNDGNDVMTDKGFVIEELLPLVVILRSSNKPLVWERYIDDTFSLSNIDKKDIGLLLDCS